MTAAASGSRTPIPRVVLLALLVGATGWAFQNRELLDPGALAGQPGDPGRWAPAAFVALFALATVLFIPGSLVGLGLLALVIFLPRLIVLAGKTNKRSAKAANPLREAGVSDVRVPRGAIEAWRGEASPAGTSSIETLGRPQ